MVTQRKINGTNNRVIVHVGVEECENDFSGMGEWNERKSGDKKKSSKKTKATTHHCATINNVITPNASCTFAQWIWY